MRRRLAAASVLTLTLGGLAACGSESDSGSDSDSGSSSSDSIDGLTVSGTFAEEPTIEVDGMDVDEVESVVPIEGEGPALADDGAALYRFVIADGGTGETVASNYQDNEPQQLVMADEEEVITDAVVDKPIGSRVVLAMPVTELLGEQGAPQVGLEPEDDLVMVIDLIEESEAPVPPLDGPEGEEVKPPTTAPLVVEEGDDVTGLDFSGLPAKQPEDFRRILLVKGEGAVVKENDSITVDYHGAVWGADAPFDESYSGEPASFQLAKGSLIDGWVQGLTGVTVGSRVMLIIPAELGYGAQGSPPNIPGDSTLVFVIDVLGASS